MANVIESAAEEVKETEELQLKESKILSPEKLSANCVSPVSSNSKFAIPGSPNKPPRKVISSSERQTKKNREQRTTPASVHLKLAKSFNAPAQKALDYALQAVRYFQDDKNTKDSEKRDLELTMSLHALAAVHCRLKQFDEAIAVLERSLELPNSEKGVDHALAIFSGYMHIGDTFGLMGKHADSLEAYHNALHLQKQAIGDNDTRVQQTYRYLIEAHLQVMEFDEAGALCEQLLKIHGEYGTPGSVEEAADRRLMALICSGKGDHEMALEYLVLASMSLISNGQDLEVAGVEVCIGDIYVIVERYEDAVFAYQKALTVFKSAKGEDHISVASVYVSLANLYMKTGKQREARTYCDSALKIYGKHDAKHPLDEITTGLTDIAALYGLMNEPERALRLLHKAVNIVENYPGQQNAVAAIEAQMGVLYSELGRYEEAISGFKSAVTKLKSAGLASQKQRAFLGMLLNQMGLASVELSQIIDAAEYFEEARNILEQTCGHNHWDTISVSVNLAGTYDALGRLDDAIKITEDVVKAKEEKLGPGNAEVEDEKLRLKQLLKETKRL